MSPLRWGAGLLLLLSCTASSLTAQSAFGQPPRPFAPDTVLQALARAYPGQVSLRHPLEGPSVAVGGKTFFWAEGRLLPFEQRRDWAAYAPHPFYEYPREVPDVARWTDQQVAQAETRLADRQAANLKRDSSFFDTLWDIRDLASADAAQRKVRFLGLTVTVHRLIREPLARVETRLTALRKEDPSLDTFLKGLARAEGYNWRDIAGTQSRSYHAYGIAVDLIPRSYKGKTPYWLWALDDEPGWYRTAWSRRWLPHMTVVRVFEEEGFVWGGKWTVFDTIHFEYRPEILALNGWK